MSLNFPTAFWKNPSEPEEDTGTPSINWTTALVWSKGNNGATEAKEFNFPLSHTTNFPFTVTDNNNSQEDFYLSYETATWQNDTNPASSTPYFGWFLTGGYGSVVDQEYDLQNYHSGSPWIIGGALGSDLKIYFEADFSTAALINTPDPNPTTDGFDYPTYRTDIYNSFIQSGNATGSFSLSATSNLTIKVSGLGEDYENAAGASNYDTMVLYLDNGSTKEFICSGAAPEDGRNVRSLDEDDNYDMQQVKLYAGNNLNTIVNTTVAPLGEPRGSDGQLVNQNTRDLGYTTTNGIGTFTKSSLAAGDYKIIIDVSTIDGIYSSGAFYGFNFTFS